MTAVLFCFTMTLNDTRTNMPATSRVEGHFAKPYSGDI